MVSYKNSFASRSFHPENWHIDNEMIFCPFFILCFKLMERAEQKGRVKNHVCNDFHMPKSSFVFLNNCVCNTTKKIKG